MISYRHSSSISSSYSGHSLESRDCHLKWALCDQGVSFGRESRSNSAVRRRLSLWSALSEFHCGALST